MKPEILQEVNLFASEFEERARKQATLPLSPKIEVVLQPTAYLWLYYMVDVERRCIFWMDDCEFDDSILPPNVAIEHVGQLRKLIILSLVVRMTMISNLRPLASL